MALSAALKERHEDWRGTRYKGGQLSIAIPLRLELRVQLKCVSGRGGTYVCAAVRLPEGDLCVCGGLYAQRSG